MRSRAMRPRTAAAIATLAVAVPLMAGCASASSAERPPSTVHRDGVTFTGPWADLFASTYADATSKAERDALRNGVISDKEYASFQASIESCLALHNVSATFDGNMGIDYTNPDRVSQEVINKCLADNGIRVLSLRDSMTRNPNNLDEGEIMAACLKRAGVVGPGFTAKDYDDPDVVAKYVNDKRFDECNADPLHFKK